MAEQKTSVSAAKDKEAPKRPAQDDEVAGKAYDGRLMRRLLTYLRPYGLQTGLSAVAIVIKAATDVSGPYLVKVAVDTYMTGTPPAHLSWLARHLNPSPITGITQLAGLYFVALLMTFGLEFVQTYLMQWTGQKIMVQNTDGGWGETCGTYDNADLRGTGPSTPSQTAWALLGLLAANDTRSDSVAKGIRWLIERQKQDGSWDELVPGRNGESYYTGTGFPRVFYLGYHLYKQYFPLLALATYERAMTREEAESAA